MNGATQRRRAPSVPPAVVLADSADLPGLSQLLSGAIPRCSPLTVSDLPWSWPGYVLVRSDDRPVAAGSLQPNPDLSYEVRGLVVDETAQGQGLGRRVMDHLVATADRRGADLVCVTRVPQFFARFGFMETTPDWLPPQRRGPDFDRAERVAMRRAPRGVAA